MTELLRSLLIGISMAVVGTLLWQILSVLNDIARFMGTVLTPLA